MNFLFTFYAITFIIYLFLARNRAVPKLLFFLASIPLFLSNSIVLSYLSFELCFFLSALVAWDADKRALYQYLFLNIFSGVIILAGVLAIVELYGDTLAPISLSPQAFLLFSAMVIATFVKIGIVPFHVWVPDLYETTPTKETAFLASFSSLTSLYFAYKILTLYPLFIMAILPILLSLYAGLMSFGRRSPKKAFGYLSVMEAGTLFSMFYFLPPPLIEFLLAMKMIRYVGLYLSMPGESTCARITFAFFGLSVMGLPPTGIVEKILALTNIPLQTAILVLICELFALFTTVKWMEKIVLRPSKHFGELWLLMLPVINILGVLMWIF